MRLLKDKNYESGNWVDLVMKDSDKEKIQKCARGHYQRRFLKGYQRVSCGDLKGKAKQYSVHYKISLKNLMKRIQDAGFDVQYIAGKHGALYVEIYGESPDI